MTYLAFPLGLDRKEIDEGPWNVCLGRRRGVTRRLHHRTPCRSLVALLALPPACHG